MTDKKIENIQDIYRLKSELQIYREITIDAARIKYTGLIRHAVVYAWHRLQDEGYLVIKDEPSQSLLLQRNRIDFWQIRLEVFRTLKHRVKVISVDNKIGLIKLQKVHSPSLYKPGISFGFVFGGTETDCSLIKKSIDSLVLGSGLAAIPHEILICGPLDFEAKNLLSHWNNPCIRYLPLDIASTPRLMICLKKNHLFANSQYSHCVIAHTRITFEAGFAPKLMQAIIEFATPAIRLADNNEKYLDFSLLANYHQLAGKKQGAIIGYKTMDADYLYFFRHRVPTIDGGLNIFNKNIITEPPYNPYVAWAEAEDAEMSQRLYAQGFLIDYLPEIICYSQTNKIHSRFETLKKPLRNIKRWYFRHF